MLEEITWMLLDMDYNLKSPYTLVNFIREMLFRNIVLAEQYHS